MCQPDPISDPWRSCVGIAMLCGWILRASKIKVDFDIPIALGRLSNSSKGVHEEDHGLSLKCKTTVKEYLWRNS